MTYVNACIVVWAVYLAMAYYQMHISLKPLEINHDGQEDEKVAEARRVQADWGQLLLSACLYISLF